MTLRKILLFGGRGTPALAVLKGLRLECPEVEVILGEFRPVFLARYSRYANRTKLFPSPVVDFSAFARELKTYVAAESIDLIIPGYEEVFHLAAALQDQPAKVFTASLEILKRLHSKKQVQELDWGDVKTLQAVELRTQEVGLPAVVKPEYSRFGIGVAILESNQQVASFRNKRLLVQEYIAGQNVSVSVLARNGKIVLITGYLTPITAGLGAGVYFVQVSLPEFVVHSLTGVVKQLALTGFYGFDFKRNQAGEYYLLECNPRLTSGIHLWSVRNMAAALLELPITSAQTLVEKQVLVASVLYGPRVLFSKILAGRTGQDVILHDGGLLAFAMQIPIFLQFLILALRHNLTPEEAMVRDIHYTPII